MLITPNPVHLGTLFKMIWSLRDNCEKNENQVMRTTQFCLVLSASTMIVFFGGWMNNIRLLKDAFSFFSSISSRAGGCGSLQVDSTQVLIGQLVGLGAGARRYDDRRGVGGAVRLRRQHGLLAAVIDVIVVCSIIR